MQCTLLYTINCLFTHTERIVQIISLISQFNTISAIHLDCFPWHQNSNILENYFCIEDCSHSIPQLNMVFLTVSKIFKLFRIAFGWKWCLIFNKALVSSTNMFSEQHCWLTFQLQSFQVKITWGFKSSKDTHISNYYAIWLEQFRNVEFQIIAITLKRRFTQHIRIHIGKHLLLHLIGHGGSFIGDIEFSCG